MADTATTCARHPDTPTGLSCSQCATAICPACAVAGPVGQKCPACARRSPAARRQARPRQYARAVAAGTVVAALAGWLYPLLRGIPLLGFFVAYGTGLAVGEAVRRGAEGNRAAPFRWLAICLAVLALGVGMVLVSGRPPTGPFGLLALGIAALGARQRF